jgi:predicted ABC-type ATPase
MPTFTVVAGPNGSGKTTLTRWGREGFQEAAVLDPDAIARSMKATGREDTSGIDAGRQVLLLAQGFLAKGESFLVETTLSGNTYLRMMAQAKLLGYRTILMYVGTNDIAINLQRVKHRVAKGGHDVPEEDQRRRYPRSMKNAAKAFDMADEAILFDNSTSLGHTRVAIKDSEGGQIFEPLPQWASFLRESTS